MIRVWAVGRCSGSALLVYTLSQVCDVVVEPQVLIPKESHLLDQLIRSILRRRWRLLRCRWLLWGSSAPGICDICHVIFRCSCPCEESTRCQPCVVARSTWVRWGIPHRSGVLPVHIFGVVPQEDGLPVVLEVVNRCPLDGGARRVGGRGSRAACGGVALPLQFVPISPGVGGRGGCRKVPGCGWREPWP